MSKKLSFIVAILREAIKKQKASSVKLGLGAFLHPCRHLLSMVELTSNITIFHV